MLATIKAGGAFVLLEAKQPEARLRDIVSLTKARFVVASPAQQDLTSKILPKVLLVSHGILLSIPASTNSSPTIDPESTLFVVLLREATQRGNELPPKFCIRRSLSTVYTGSAISSRIRLCFVHLRRYFILFCIQITTAKPEIPSIPPHLAYSILNLPSS
jgi:hypothetical protein